MKYNLIRSKRRTLCLEIKNATLVVRAPFLYPQFKINQFVNAKENWILKHLSNFKRKPIKKPNQILFEGKLFKIKIIFNDNKQIDIERDQITVSASNRVDAKKILKKFFEEKTKAKIEKLVQKYNKSISLSGYRMFYKSYKSKWGSCSAKKSLSFNIALAMAPDEVIEYVFIHEFVHVNHMNHSKKFWQEVARFDPDYKKHRKWLNHNRDMLKI